MIKPRRYCSALAKWLADRDCHFHVTLNFNDPGRHTYRPTMTGFAMQERLREFDRRSSRLLLGKRWHRWPHRRHEGFFFTEKRITNPHWHGLIWLPEPKWQAAEFKELVEQAWKRVAPAGSACVRPYDPASRLSTGIPVHAYYPTKELLIGDHIEHFCILSQFRT